MEKNKPFKSEYEKAAHGHKGNKKKVDDDGQVGEYMIQHKTDSKDEYDTIIL